VTAAAVPKELSASVRRCFRREKIFFKQ